MRRAAESDLGISIFQVEKFARKILSGTKVTYEVTTITRNDDSDRKINDLFASLDCTLCLLLFRMYVLRGHSP